MRAYIGESVEFLARMGCKRARAILRIRSTQYLPRIRSLPFSLPSLYRSYIHSCINSRRHLALFRVCSCLGRIYDPSLIARIHILASILLRPRVRVGRGETCSASNPCLESKFLHKPTQVATRRTVMECLGMTMLRGFATHFATAVASDSVGRSVAR